MKYILFIFTFLFSVHISFGQDNPVFGDCVSDSLVQKRMNSDPEFKQEQVDFEKLLALKRTIKIQKNQSTTPAVAGFEKIYRIPVVVHVVHRGEPIGQGINISDDHIREILKQSNDNYRKSINTTGYGNGVDTGVEFALAVRDPNGNLTNGIERIDMSGNASYMALGLNADFEHYFDSLAKYNLYPKDRYLNIYVVSGSDGGNWVAFGGGGIVCVSAYVFNLHGVVTHEIGHEMSLAHTFAGETQNPDKSFNCPPVETDPYKEGDMCPDTPRHTEFSQTCGATVQNPCYPGDPTQVDDLYERNYMAYGRCGGGNGGMFSNDQTTRIRAKAESKQKYYQYNQLVPPVLPNVDFYADNTVSTDVNIPVKFFEKSAGIPNTYMAESEWPDIQFAWTFKNGSTIYTSSRQNPVMKFSVPGYYDVTLTITTPLGPSTSTKQQYLIVQSQEITPVCSVDLVEGAYYQSLHTVKFNTIYKETRIDFSDVYLNLRATNNTIVNAGQTYPLTINVRGSSNVPQNVKAYIDYNDNGSFEDAELIFKGLSTTDFQYFNTNVTIPQYAIRNKLLTMRIIGYSGDGTNNCGRIGNPDVEDYGVVIKGDCTTDLIEFSANTILGYAGSVIQFHDNSCVSDLSFVNNTSYNWTFSNGAATYSSTKQHPNVSFLQLGVYDVTLAITTPSGIQTLTKENFIKITEAATPVCDTFTGSVNYYLYRSISKVVFNTINKETSTRTNEGYKNFKNTDYTVVKEGLTYPLSINLGTSGGDLARYKVYIDYNDNGTFEDSELVVTGTSTSSPIVTLSQNITIPFTSIKNRMLTMRVMTSSGDILSACSNISIPDVEDYGVMILSNCNTETIDFESDKNMGCSNTTIKFIDKSCIPFSTNFNKYTYEWIYTSGLNRYTSTEQNPSFTFIQTGVYTVTLNINTPSGIKTITKENYIKIAAPPIVLCTNITSTDTPTSRNINRVIFNSIDKKTSSSINEGYQDFRCANYTLVKVGQIYPLTIYVSSTGSYLERFKVYIDYNNDAIFSNSELIFEGKATQASSIQSFKKDIVIPPNFVKNTLLTMRVIGNSEDINSNCGSYKNADIEDYGIMIENNDTSEIIDFESNEILGFVNKNIKFIDKSVFPHTSNFDSAPYTYQWTFANALKTYTSTDQDPSILFDQVGVFNATLIINTPSGVKTLTKENYIKIVDLPLVVCNAITSSNNGYTYRTINRVTFNTIDKKTSTSVNEGYQDYRLTDSTRVLAGQTYPLSITTSSSSQSLENFKVYIDYNNDALFASSELVFEGVATTNSSVQTFSKDVIIPANAVKNTFLTMRVIGDAKSITSTCGTYDNPDIEDYSVYIDDNCTTEVIDFIPDIFIGCINSTIKFFDYSCVPYNSNFSNYTYNWKFSNGPNTYTANGQYPSITFAQTGLYTVTLNITTPVGVKTLIKENYIRITEPPLVVCGISPSSGTWGNRAISKVVFNTISKMTPTNINEVYKDFRCTDITSVIAGQTYPLSINIGTTNGDKARYKVYIDYNYNGTFEETEVVFSGIFSGTTSAYTSGLVNKDILIPTNGVKNKLLTMRVMTAVSDINTACSAITVPDVEDYGIIISGYTAAPSATTPQVFCAGKTIADLVATGSNIKWYANPEWGTALEATTTLAAGTYYASQTINSIESARTSVVVTLNTTAAPTAPAIQLTCPGIASYLTNLEATIGSGQTIEWYSALTGGVALTNSTVLVAGTTYFAQATDNITGCSSARIPVRVSTNNALHFDGLDDHVILINNTLSNVSSAVTIEAWIYIEKNQNSEIFSRNVNGTDLTDVSYSLRYRNGKLMLHVGNNTNYYSFSSVNTIPSNEWIHVAGSFGSGNIGHLYVNGAEVPHDVASSSSSSLVIGNHSGAFNSIGKYQTSSASYNFFKGKIDELRIWNIVRSATEIQNNYSISLTNTSSGLLSQYTFNQGIANNSNLGVNTLFDKVSSADNASISNLTLNGSASNFVNGFIPSITGQNNVAIGLKTQLSNVLSGGSWAVSDANIASIDNNGLVSGISEGTTTITYSLCKNSSTKVITVSATDSDGDGVLNSKEVSDSTDPTNRCDFFLTSQTEQTSAEWKSADCDNDGLSNSEEVTKGTNSLKADTDGDGLKDGEEITKGTDPLKADTDGDGLKDGEEITKGTDPLKVDTDGDGLKDNEEIVKGTDPLKADTDGDGLKDNEEITKGTDPLKLDTDGDGLKDNEEITKGTDPLKSDTDGDGLKDGEEITKGADPLKSDTDGDGLKDGEEITKGTDPLKSDTDGDGLSDGEEITKGTNPLKVDTDGDGLKDGEEITNGTNPLKVDTDSDSLSDREEITKGTNPLKADTDGDGVNDNLDNCPLTLNSNQSDLDNDGIGDVCDGADTDGDGLTDGEEIINGTNLLKVDTDSDGLSDKEEINRGTNPLKADTDGDGLKDGEEITKGTDALKADTDSDGLKDGEEITKGTDPLKADTDSDGLKDGEEITKGTDPLKADTDGDGLKDNEEITKGTDPLKADTDVDGLKDGEEITKGTDPLKADMDSDGLKDGEEITRGTNPLKADTDSDGLKDGEEITKGTDPLKADTDSDGLKDGEEITKGTDPLKADTDSDGLKDGEEITKGTDPLKADMDGDGLKDNEEITKGTDPLKADTDGDGLKDGEEITKGTDALKADTDSDGLKDGEEITKGTDPLKADTDGDGLKDNEEITKGTDPLKADTDGDALKDGEEITKGTDPLKADTDGDALKDGEEITKGTDPLKTDTDSDGLSDKEEITKGTDPLKADTDGDALKDGEEITKGTDPLKADTDGDGLKDNEEITKGTDPLKADTDGDGLKDGEEITKGTDPLKADTDGDGLKDGEEITKGTDPLKADTDSDGLKDGEEITKGTDPLKADTDSDGLKDGEEITKGTDPLKIDTDGDGLKDGEEITKGTDPLKADTDGDGIIDSKDKCPNSTLGVNVNLDGCEIFRLPVSNFSLIGNSATCVGISDGAIKIAAIDENYIYTATVTKAGKLIATLNLSKVGGMTKFVNSLGMGTYLVCFTVEGQSDYSQCFSIIVSETPALSVSTSIDRNSKIVALNLSGSSKYYVTLNGITTITKEPFIQFDLKAGNNTVEVKTELSCQGIYFEKVFVSENIILYPNPTRGYLKVFVGGIDKEINVSIVDLLGNVIIQRLFKVPLNRVIELDISDRNSGVYIIELKGQTVTESIKIIKD